MTKFINLIEWDTSAREADRICHCGSLMKPFGVGVIVRQHDCRGNATGLPLRTHL